MSNVAAGVPGRDDERLARLTRAGMFVFVIAIVVAMFPLSPQPAVDVKVVLYQAAALVIGGTWLTALALGRVRFAWPRAFGPALVLMLVAQALSLVATEHRAIGVLLLTQSVCLAVLFFTASQVYRSEGEARPLLVAFCIGVGLSTVYAFAQKAGYDPFPWEASQRETSTYLELPGTFGNPNIAGHALILALIFSVYLTLDRATRWCGIFIPLFGAHLYLTNFRSGLIALVAGAAVAGLAALFARSRLTPAGAARATVAGALVAAIAVGGLLAGFVYAASSGHRLIDDSILLRINAFYGAADMIAERPLVGYGLGRYGAENPPFWTDFEQRWLAEKHLMNEHVHSDVLETWVETGVLGVLAYVLLLVAGVCWGARRLAESSGDDRRFALALTAFFAAFAADGLFGFNSRVPVTATILFLVAGVTEGVCAGRKDFAAPRVLVRGGVPAIAVLLIVSVFIGSRDFLGKVSIQSAQNTLAFNALDAADRASARALKLAPYDALAHVTRAETERKLERPESAVAQYEAALQIQPHAVPILLELARTRLTVAVEFGAKGARQESIGALNEARKATNRAIELCRYLPDGAEILGRVALAQAQLQDGGLRAALLSEAEKTLLRALRNGAQNPAALFVLLAECRTLMEDHDGAENYLMHAVAREPASELGWESFLDFAERRQRFEQFDRALQNGIARAEQRKDGVLTGRLIAWRARSYLLRGQAFTQVADEFERALRVAPDVGKIWEDYAAAARLAGEEPRFLESVENTSSTLQHVSAVRTATAGEPGTAAAELHALAVRMTTPGASELRVEDLAWALDYVQMTTVDPGSSESVLTEGLIPIAAAYELLDLPENAVSAYATLWERSSDSTRVTAAIKVGALLVRLSRADEAVRLLEATLQSNANNVALRIEYARALNAAGMPASARLELNKLLTQLSLDPAQRAAVEAELAAFAP